jgi:ABC-type uncharacterized transport system substrate-binding protein
VNRRGILRLGIGIGLSTRAPSLWAQNAAAGMRSVGVLAPSTRANEEITLKPFFDEMRRLGWIEGQIIAYARTYADNLHQNLPRLAAELVARKPELIYAPTQQAAVAAKNATGTVPIVFGTGTDPVGLGLVSSLARPGRNVTGVVSVIDSLAPKRVGLLREMLPSAKRIGLLGDPTDPRMAVERRALAPVAKARGLVIIVGEATDPAEFDTAVASLIAQRVEVIIAVTSITLNLRPRLIELADRERVPVVEGLRPHADAGALFSYGASLSGQLRRSAQLVDKILKGAKPADIPVEQPTNFELVINLRTAKSLGIAIPESLLLRADEVIQ